MVRCRNDWLAGSIEGEVWHGLTGLFNPNDHLSQHQAEIGWVPHIRILAIIRSLCVACTLRSRSSRRRLAASKRRALFAGRYRHREPHGPPPHGGNTNNTCSGQSIVGAGHSPATSNFPYRQPAESVQSRCLAGTRHHHCAVHATATQTNWAAISALTCTGMSFVGGITRPKSRLPASADLRREKALARMIGKRRSDVQGLNAHSLFQRTQRPRGSQPHLGWANEAIHSATSSQRETVLSPIPSIRCFKLDA